MSDRESPARNVAQRVGKAILRVLADGSGPPGIDLVAERMGTSIRTLQRRLTTAGLTYTQILQSARCAAAQRLLTDRQPTIGEVARTLGYSDPAHFTRAFLRWTGLTPRQFRSRHALN